MPIKPEEIDPSKLPVGMRGYQREATDELLKRVAWDYRQAVRAQETWAKDERKLKDRVLELEEQVASQGETFARAQQSQQERFEQELRKRTSALEAEVARLQGQVRAHEGRDEMTRALLATAQRSAREMRESVRAECEALLKAAQRRAAEIEQGAHASVRHSATEIDRLKRLEADLKAQLQRTLESVLGKDEAPEQQAEPQQQPEPFSPEPFGAPASVD